MAEALAVVVAASRTFQKYWNEMSASWRAISSAGYASNTELNGPEVLDCVLRAHGSGQSSRFASGIRRPVSYIRVGVNSCEREREREQQVDWLGSRARTNRLNTRLSRIDACSLSWNTILSMKELVCSSSLREDGDVLIKSRGYNCIHLTKTPITLEWQHDGVRHSLHSHTLAHVLRLSIHTASW